MSNFVRGEYIRGFVTGLIDLFSAIKEEDSVNDGIHFFNANMATRAPRKVANALHSAVVWLQGQEDSLEVHKTLRRLGEYIRNTLTRFDMEFPRRVRDPLNCDIGIMSFPQESYNDSHILDFYQQYEEIREGPSCDQCSFRDRQVRELSAAGIDICGDENQKLHAAHRGYIQQAKMTAKAVQSKLKTPSCWYCDRLGDTIISLSAPKDSTIVTGDARSFPILTSLLKKSLRLIPSLQELRALRGQN
jgi:hypothetical protein